MVDDIEDLSPASDSDWASADGASLDVTTLASSVLNYEYKNGRRYHAYRSGAYLMPNDEEEQDRMDLLHHIYALILDGGLHMAPIKSHPERVLDLGTGTGIWAIDFADQYKSAEVLGNDLSPIQPSWIPPNLQFEIDDYEADWVYSRPFDYIHGRELAGAVSNFDRLFRQAFKHLKPGGYLEMQSFRIEVYADDDSLDRAPYTTRMCSLIQEASVKFGKPMANMDEWADRMIKEGFEDVTCKIIKVPISPWPLDKKQKEIGKYFQAQQMQGIQSYVPELLQNILKWGPDEVEVLMAGARKELFDTTVHQYGKLYFVYGRKPGG
ncbi:S-adenosyl-L-methionine-dependent methyltransferase [Aspergillus caelatus]|uniref:S-adenosyl-L-methionine-dependent methyltransferase n=1 Tax=Aspergillus caelatus TaxID=61420 RepID=A0A5N6ZIZ7_9EURO|nr:S-adenosyl-L-methionine-dependent methyltransferase [Aspergillus caelatus]KAE8357614.1 S-adenosyl-L-methionine-dependent methyltransferase [Aspergillus caelatus]